MLESGGGTRVSSKKAICRCEWNPDEDLGVGSEFIWGCEA